MAVDTLGHLLAAHVTPTKADDRARVGQLVQAVQVATGESVDLADINQGYTNEMAAAVARRHGIKLEVVKSSEAKQGFVLLPCRWVVERTFTGPFASVVCCAITSAHLKLSKTCTSLH